MLDMQQETSRLWKQSRCVTCRINQKDVLILDCKHLCVCKYCVRSLNCCPTCNGHIKSVIAISFRGSHDSLLELRNETMDLWIKMQCKSCGKEKKNVIIMDCGHLALCKTCLASVKECPICFSRITNALTVFY